MSTNISYSSGTTHAAQRPIKNDRVDDSNTTPFFREKAGKGLHPPTGWIRACVVLCVLMLGGILAPQKAFAINGSSFNSNRLIIDQNWNATYGYLEFKVFVMDNYGSGRNEWIDLAYVHINGQNIFDIYGPDTNSSCSGDEWHNFRIGWRNEFPNGVIYVGANTTTTGACTFPGTNMPQGGSYNFFPLSSYGTNTHFTISRRLGVGSVPNNNLYAIFRWYPNAPITGDFYCDIKITNIRIKEEGSNATMYVSDVSKTVLITRPAIPATRSITDGTIQQGGGIKISANASEASNLILTKSGSDLETQSGSTANFTGKYITTRTEFLNGVNFGFRIQRSTGNPGATYQWNATETVTSQRTGVFTNNLAASTTTCGQVVLSWQIQNPSVAQSYVNTQGFDLQVRKGNTGAWTTIPSEPGYNHVNGGTTSYSHTYKLPDGDMNKGTVNYQFRIKRKFIDWDDESFGSENSSLFQRNASLNINTNYKELTNTRIVIGTGNYPRLSWSFTTAGFECTDNISLRLRIGGGSEVAIPKTDVLAGSYQTKNGDGMINCQPQRYELILQYGALASITYTVSNDYIYEAAGKREFEKIEVTPGYYSDKVNVRWFLRKDYDEFNRFRLLRKELSQTENDYVTITEITHNGGILQYSYDDHNVSAGMYYVYRVEGIYQCSEAVGSLSSPAAIGFSQPYGSVSGRITYTGSNAVSDVSVVLSTNDALRSNRELDFSDQRTNMFVEIPVNSRLLSRDGFSFQTWIKPTQAMTDGHILHNEGRFRVLATVAANTGRISVYIGSILVSTPNDALSLGNYQHVTVTAEPLATDYRTYQISIYINGQLQRQQTASLASALTNNSATISLGNRNRGVSGNIPFSGLMDDIRLWNKVLSENEILLNYDRIISGKEAGIAAYYKCDETDEISEALYDCSAVGTNFNGNHAIKGSGVNRSDVPLDALHLMLKGVTDLNGNYSITNAIPYTSEGTSYTITPMLGVHRFDPSQRPLYFSSDSRVFNNIDFTDVSSFDVSGTVVYEGGTYPVEGCMFEIDDRLVVRSNGTPVTTDRAGMFTISVPIGIHTVRVVKLGHTFVNDGLLLESKYDEETNETYLGNLNYNAPVSNVKLENNTRVKLIGRVTGGTFENDKPLGFGESVNNIGVETVTLRKSRIEDYKFVEGTPVEKVYRHDDGWRRRKADDISGDQTTVEYHEDKIVIHISPVTGEFVAWVYPEMYNVGDMYGEIRAPGYVRPIYDRGEMLDLSTAPVANDNMLQRSIRTWTDSVRITRPGVVNEYEPFENSDTLRYHAKWTYYYQSDPTFSITQLVNNEPVSFFGEKTYTVVEELTGDSEDVELYDEASGTYLFGQPVFRQGVEYAFLMKAYEEYTNYAGDDPVTYPYPINAGVVNMTNDISEKPKPSPIEMNENGEAIYEFTAGPPNLTIAQNGFVGIISIGAMSYYSNLGNEYFMGWHLGDRVTGTDFMTAGPDQVEIILRDPPGSKSKAYIEEQSTVTVKSSLSVDITMADNTKVKTGMGPNLLTFVGIGAGTINEAKIKNEITADVTMQAKVSSGLEHTTKMTYTEKIETSNSSSFVGSKGDVFVGNSMNILYGLTNSIKIAKNYSNDFDNAADGEPFTSVGNYSIVPGVSLALGETFATRFVYTQASIEDIMIPKWRDNLAIILLPVGTPVNPAVITNPVYVSKLPHSDKNFGKPNIDKETFGAEASNSCTDGPSYTVIFPTIYDMNDFVTDSVIYYNNQINNWIALLEQNEKEKVQTEYTDNYSFGAGATVTHSMSKSSSMSHSFSFNIMIKASAGLSTGAEVNNIGVTIAKTLTHTHSDQIKTSFTEQTDIKTGFTLQDDDKGDQLTVDYGMSKGGTFVFKTRGGRTSCPYEGQELTKYFEPKKHILNEATMQIDVPKLRLHESSSPYLLNVPANRPATFLLAMENESETGDDGSFNLVVSDGTNPYGAALTIDGIELGSSRTFKVKTGETLLKTLSVAKGTVDDYSLKLSLRSSCQATIKDDVTIEVKYIPAVSDVAILEPRQNWILNSESPSGDILNITLSDFDVNFPNFGYIDLQFRPIASPSWSTITTFYPSHLYEAAQGIKEDIGNQAVLVYPWRMPSADGQYEIRATTVAVNSAGGVIIGNPISSFTTEAVSGYKDMQRPVSMGAPSPSNGILAAGDELSITFNKDIQAGMLTQNNFSISGVLNEQEIAEPNVGISFAGTQSVRTELPIFANGSFSIETWFMRRPNTAGTLFAYGSGDNYISLGFNAAGNAILKIGSESYTSTIAIANDETWKFIALCFNRDENTASVYEFEGATTNVLIANRLLTAKPETQGILITGNNAAGSDGFSGAIAQLHFYGINRLFADVAADKSKTKSGREFGLIGHWICDEGEGAIAIDKARSRHLSLGNAGWYIYPPGYAKQTNGSYFYIPTGTYPLHSLSDFTLEFWFRSANVGSNNNSTLLCADNGYIAVNATGGLTLYKPDGTLIQTLTIANLINTQWHHIAMTVRRNGSVNVYIDGVNVAVFNEKQLGTFASGNYYFGAKRTPPNTFDQYFTGYFDEIRIWNSALTRDGIMLNKNNKLRGDEPGLQAYYPFEYYLRESNGLLTVMPSDDNMVIGEDNTAGGTVSGFSSTAVFIKDARPVEFVPFTYVASNNKIVFTLDPSYFSRVEGVTLNLSVKDVRDMRNNKSNTESWTAYVRRNALRWDADPVNIEMQEGELRSFTARITNTGGVSVNYTLENLPSWLTVNNSAGTLQPLANRDLIFTVSQGANIGNYETAIGLTSGNGVTELLPLQLKVSRQRPDWKVNPNEFATSMNITGRIQIEGVFQEDAEDLLAAFIGDLCLGVTSPIYVGESNAYFTFADIYGNEQHNNQQLTFKLWDASTGRIYPQIAASVGEIRFSPSRILGNASNPVIFNAMDVAALTIDLKTGWNWISANVLNENPSILAQMKLSLANNGEIIKGRDAYIQQPFWMGTLESISEKTMYSVKVARDHTLTLTGQYANPTTTQIAIAQGWNWIGYIPPFTLPVSSALASVNAQAGDQIKGQIGYATYTGTSWIGSLAFMQQGKGYMYYSNSAAALNLVYPSAAPVRMSLSKDLAPPPSVWSANVERHSSNMTMTAIVINNDEEMRSDLIEIAAFSGTECRGSALLQYVESLGKYIGFLMIHGDGKETISLKAYDHATGAEYDAENAPIQFKADAIFGNPNNPAVVVLKSGINVPENGEINLSREISVYPNPASDHLYITHPWASIDLVEIVDMGGRIIFRQKDFTDASISISDMTAGAYLLRFINNEQVMVFRFVKE